jgi:hypothetical protein
MERLNYSRNEEITDKSSRSSKSSKKRKWREIENIKENKRLMAELIDIDASLEYSELKKVPEF